MNNRVSLQGALSFLNCQLGPAKPPKLGERKLAITLSRQTGAGAHSIAGELAAYLDQQASRKGVPWTVFDRNLVERVLTDHQLPARLAGSMTEDRVSELEDIMQELLGTQPSSWKLVGQVSETVLKLAALGNVILVGRGANIITSKLDHVFHVRLIGSLERRTERAMEIFKLGRKAAATHVEKEDRGRRRYLRKYFGADIADPLLYHLVLNTDWIDPHEAARLIGEAAIHSVLHPA